MIVVDASVAIEVLLRSPGCEAATTRLLADGEVLHAPELIDLEVAQVLRRLVANGSLETSKADRAIEHLRVFPITRHSHSALLQRVWQLRYSITAYDAAYVALAEGLDATLVTRDRKLRGAPGSKARIEVV